jgi:hypothetical protein
MYPGIDVHKRHAQVAVMDEAGETVEEVRIEVLQAVFYQETVLSTTVMNKWLQLNIRLCHYEKSLPRAVP